MAKQSPLKEKSARGPGRPATGKTKGKLSATVNPALIEAATKAAYKKGESLSQFVSRAIQNLILEQ